MNCLSCHQPETYEHDLSSQCSRYTNDVFIRTKEANTFIDKTFLIKTFLNIIEVEKERFFTITTPRGFGKSVNLHMLKRFFEISIDSKGDPIEDVMVTFNYSLFVNTKIYQDRLFTQHFGKSPVMFVSFKCDQIVKSFHLFELIFQQAIHNSYTNHAYLQYSPKLTQSEKNLVRLWCGKGYKSTNKLKIFVGLRSLTEYIYKHYKTNVYVLIDDYDAPLLNSVFNLKTKHLDRAIEYIKTIYSTLLKNNTHIQCGILTGISRMHDLAYDLSYIQQYTFLGNHKFVEFFGLTSADVSYLFDKFNIDVTQQSDILDYYKGYKSLNGSEIYNSESIAKYLYLGHIKDFWQDSPYLTNFENVFHMNFVLWSFEEVLKKDYTNCHFLKASKKRDIERIQGMIFKNISYYRPEVIYSFLFDRGYFTYISSKTSIDNIYKLAIPNQEVWFYCMKLLNNYYVKNCKFNETSIIECVSLFNKLNPKVNESDIHSLNSGIHKLFSTLKKNTLYSFNKNSVGGLLLYVLLQTKFKCKSSIFVNNWWRINFVLFCENFGIIIKLKVAYLGSPLKSSKNALESIIKKEYYKIFEKEICVNEYLLMAVSVTDYASEISYLINSLNIKQAQMVESNI